MPESLQFETFSRDLADRFRDVGTMLLAIASPGQVEDLLRSLAADDAAKFHELLREHRLPDFEPVALCGWTRRFFDALVSTPIYSEEEWFLRRNLSPADRLRVLALIQQFSYPVEPGFWEGSTPVEPGPFLEALRVEGFVLPAPNVVFIEPTRAMRARFCY